MENTSERIPSIFALSLLSQLSSRFVMSSVLLVNILLVISAVMSLNYFFSVVFLRGGDLGWQRKFAKIACQVLNRLILGDLDGERKFYLEIIVATTPAPSTKPIYIASVQSTLSKLVGLQLYLDNQSITQTLY